MEKQARESITAIESLSVRIIAEERGGGNFGIAYDVTGHGSGDWPDELSPLAGRMREPDIREAVVTELLRQGKATHWQPPEEDRGEWETIKHRRYETA